MSKIRTAESADSDLVWGAAAIGEEINRTAQQVYHLHGSGALAGAVSKLGHKTLVASRSRLRKLPFARKTQTKT